MIKKKFNKSNLNFIILEIVIIFLTFFILLSFLTKSNQVVSSQTDNLVCRGYIESMSHNPLKFVNQFIYGLNLKCKKDKITISDNSKQEVYKKIADESASCWFRYGEGKYDFMKDYKTTGNWCFLCGVINVKNGKEKYDYNDFIDWLGKNKYKVKDGKVITYKDYIRLKYSDISQKDINNLLFDIGSINDKNFYGIKLLLINKMNRIVYLKNKKIDTTQPIYVVFRYDKPPVSFEKKLHQAVMGGIYSMGASFVISTVVESVLTFGIGGLISLATKPVEIGSSVMDAYRVISKTEKITNEIEEASKIEKLIEIPNLMNNIEKENNLIKIYDASNLDKLTNLKSILKGEKSLDDIDKINDLKTIDKLLDKTIFTYDKEKKLYTLAKEEGFSTEEINNYEKLSEEVKDIKKEIDDGKQISEANKLKAKRYVKLTLMILSGEAGAYIGYNMNFNKNQYVSIMTPEEYYKYCGTNPIS